MIFQDVLDCEQSYFFLRSRPQSDGKIMQIRKVNEVGLDVSRGSRLCSSAGNHARVTELRKRKRQLAAYRCSEILSINLFADDIDLFLSHKNTDTLQKPMNQELRNIKKTHFKIF